jgi:hypothetical protein
MLFTSVEADDQPPFAMPIVAACLPAVGALGIRIRVAALSIFAWMQPGSRSADHEPLID